MTVSMYMSVSLCMYVRRYSVGYGLWVVVYMCEPTSDRDSGVGYQDTSHIRLYICLCQPLLFSPTSLKACASYTVDYAFHTPSTAPNCPPTKQCALKGLSLWLWLFIGVARDRVLPWLQVRQTAAMACMYIYTFCCPATGGDYVHSLPASHYVTRHGVKVKVRGL